MPYDISWHIPDRVISLKLYGDISTDESLTIVDKVRQKMQEGEAPIYLLADATEIKSAPLSLQFLKNTTPLSDEKSGGGAIIANGVIKFTTNMVSHLIDKPLKSVTSIEDGITFLKSLDDSLQLADT